MSVCPGVYKGLSGWGQLITGLYKLPSWQKDSLSMWMSWCCSVFTPLVFFSSLGLELLLSMYLHSRAFAITTFRNKPFIDLFSSLVFLSLWGVGAFFKASFWSYFLPIIPHHPIICLMCPLVSCYSFFRIRGATEGPIVFSWGTLPWSLFSISDSFQLISP